MQHRRSNNKNEIPPGGNLAENEANSFTSSPLRPVAIVRLAELPAHHKTAAGTASAVSCSI
jgi:hypothetical protein